MALGHVGSAPAAASTIPFRTEAPRTSVLAVGSGEVHVGIHRH